LPKIKGNPTLPSRLGEKKSFSTFDDREKKFREEKRKELFLAQKNQGKRNHVGIEDGHLAKRSAGRKGGSFFSSLKADVRGGKKSLSLLVGKRGEADEVRHGLESPDRGRDL